MRQGQLVAVVGLGLSAQRVAQALQDRPEVLAIPELPEFPALTVPMDLQAQPELRDRKAWQVPPGPWDRQGKRGRRA